MITLQTIESAFHSIKIQDADGDTLAIDATGKIGAVVEGTVELGATTLAALENITVDGTVELGATTLAALETITVEQGTSPWVIGDGGGSITVDGTVAATQSGSWEVELGATTLAALESITVVATDLDIRDLAFATDKVDVSGSVIETVEGGYASWKTSKVSVTTTSAALVTAFSGRLRVEIQNLGSSDIYIKESNTAVLDGIRIPKGTSYEQALDDGAAIYAVASSGTVDVRVAEYAA